MMEKFKNVNFFVFYSEEYDNSRIESNFFRNQNILRSSMFYNEFRNKNSNKIRDDDEIMFQECYKLKYNQFIRGQITYPRLKVQKVAHQSMSKIILRRFLNY